jgi:DNA-binding beta-propeller fold protein YncE
LAGTGDYRITEFSADGTPRNAWWFGSRGTMYSPTSMAVTANGTIFVVDNSSTVQVFGPDRTFLTAWGGPGAFWALTDVEVDPHGDVWVVDAGSQQVIRYHPDDSTYSRMTETLRLGADGTLGSPVSIAFDADDNVYVADQGLQRILKLTRDGDIITMWGSYGTDDGQFQTVNQVAVSGNSVYVLEYGWAGTLRLHQFDRDGNFARRSRDVESLMMYQASMVVGSDGFVHITDRDRYRIAMFTPSCTFYASWGDGVVGYPQVLAIEPDGDMYVGEEGVLRTFEQSP